MNFFEIAAGIIGSLFATGIALGFLIVEVLSGGDRKLPGRR